MNFFSCDKYTLLRPDHPEVLLRTRLSISKDYHDFYSKHSLKLLETTPGMRNFSPQDYLKRKMQNLEYETHARLGLNKGELIATPVAVYPARRDARLSVQQGAFTLYGGKDYSGNDYIYQDRLPTAKGILELQEKVLMTHEQDERANNSARSLFLRSALIPKQVKSTIMRELMSIGINESMLFPELENQTSHLRKFWFFIVKNLQTMICYQQQQKIPISKL